MRPSEGALIGAFLRPFGLTAHAGVLVGAGASDCAVVEPRRGYRLVLKTDAVLDRVHFDLRKCTPADAGWKALAVNLSDLAAAGARPRWFLCALGVPTIIGDPTPVARGIAQGMAQLAKKHGCALVGGNVTAAEQWSITVSALGEARRTVERGGGSPGDAIVVVGTLGDAAAGLRPHAPARALAAQRRPQPLVAEGLAAAPLASASVDVSDGFVKDLGHLCAASNCGAVIECSQLPLGKAARKLTDGLDLALGGGEDYALVYAVAHRRLRAFLRKVPGSTVVGRLVEGQAIQLTELGQPRPLPKRTGYDHLA